MIAGSVETAGNLTPTVGRVERDTRPLPETIVGFNVNKTLKFYLQRDNISRTKRDTHKAFPTDTGQRNLASVQRLKESATIGLRATRHHQVGIFNGGGEAGQEVWVLAIAKS